MPTFHRFVCVPERRNMMYVALLALMTIQVARFSDAAPAHPSVGRQTPPTLPSSKRAHFQLETPDAKEITSLLLRVLNPPVPFAADDGKTHLVTELLITNTGNVPLHLTRIEVQDGSSAKPVLTLAGHQVATNMTAVHHPVDTDILPAGQAGLVYLNVSVDSAAVPDTLIHQVSAENTTTVVTATGAKIAVDKETKPPVLGPPVAGGTWVAAEACCHKSHHRRAPFNLNGAYFLSQRYAIDFIKVVDGKLWSGDNPKDLRSWYTYGQDALAPADSIVVSVLENEPEVTPFEKNPKQLTIDNVTGNHLMFDLGNGLFVVYAHLQPGSIRVKQGDKVRRGQKVALVGNSGNTDAPHLHVHVMDAPKVIQSDGVPFLLEDFRLVGRYESIDTLLPDPSGTPPQPMIPQSDSVAHTGEYPLELSVISWPSSR